MHLKVVEERTYHKRVPAILHQIEAEVYTFLQIIDSHMLLNCGSSKVFRPYSSKLKAYCNVGSKNSHFTWNKDKKMLQKPQVRTKILKTNC